ncbi:10142_t:CDS:2, partial [Racocetra persica]
EYFEVSNNPKAGTYHKSCWAEIEKEQQNSNNYPTCQECKKLIKAGEERVSETMPDAFSPQTFYYHKACFKKTQCSKCSNPRLEEELLRNAEYYQSLFYDLTEEEKREGKRRLKETIETIERDLYPERNKGKGGSEDFFYSDKKVRYIPEIAGRLKFLSDEQQNKTLQWFSQDIHKFQKDELVKFEEPLELEKEVKKIETKPKKSSAMLANELFVDGIKKSASTVCRLYKKYGISHLKPTYHYSEQQALLGKIKPLVDTIRILPSSQVLAEDECAFYLNEAPRRLYGLKGERIISWKPGNI